ncbi:hypothetical protein IWQ57_000590 [Coemansia nantahalensis]|uniref:Uncharacterized protein n=1 Tax=Coemansia nantahalensis TaxID=2789366 RepID=A0ACC1K826_9FUNG|nr:hypothetical protein IWQ57_000590 [Coemansia nantahalensis]
MENVVISGAYPERDGTVAPARAGQQCPFLGGSEGTAKRYSGTRQDESMRAALKLLRPTRDDFRLGDYAQCFNWDEIGREYQRQLGAHAGLPDRASEDGWYAVAFRSKRNPECRHRDLFDADRDAYTEAFETTNGALLVYWFTGLDADNNCLATCVWTGRDIARSINGLPKHKEAARLADGAYIHHHIDRYSIAWDSAQRRLDVVPWGGVSTR